METNKTERDRFKILEEAKDLLGEDNFKKVVRLGEKVFDILTEEEDLRKKASKLNVIEKELKEILNAEIDPIKFALDCFFLELAQFVSRSR